MRALLFLGTVERSFPIPDDAPDNLAENAPQALLRDLHRPDKRFKVSPFDFVRVHFKSEHDRHTDDIKRAVATDYRVNPVALVQTWASVRDSRRELRRILRSDWTKAPKLASAVESHVPNPLELAKFFDV
ncbi:MAG TPA: hypothetical protein VKE22_06010 [Haliangiales bacterium]|nr:hypothetical protein [Haliangiales bacterium]